MYKECTYKYRLPSVAEARAANQKVN